MPLTEKGNAAYKDHKVTEIEIAPALYVGLNPPAALAEANPSAIREISLSVLKGGVKPSRIEGGTLRAQALETGRCGVRAHLQLQEHDRQHAPSNPEAEGGASYNNWITDGVHAEKAIAKILMKCPQYASRRCRGAADN